MNHLTKKEFLALFDNVPDDAVINIYADIVNDRGELNKEFYVAPDVDEVQLEHKVYSYIMNAMASGIRRDWCDIAEAVVDNSSMRKLGVVKDLVPSVCGNKIYYEVRKEDRVNAPGVYEGKFELQGDYLVHQVRVYDYEDYYSSGQLLIPGGSNEYMVVEFTC